VTIAACAHATDNAEERLHARLGDVSDVPWRARPSWLIDRGVEERWQQRGWQEWEILRQRFDEFGVELGEDGS